MSLLTEMQDLGVNVDEGLERLMGNVSLYEKMLGSFAKMMKDTSFQPDFDLNDYSDIIEKAHTIKGTSGNLSITPIYKAYTEIVSLLRADQPQQAKTVLEAVLPIQKQIIDCIEHNSGM